MHRRLMHLCLLHIRLKFLDVQPGNSPFVLVFFSFQVCVLMCVVVWMVVPKSSFDFRFYGERSKAPR